MGALNRDSRHHVRPQCKPANSTPYRRHTNVCRQWSRLYVHYLLMQDRTRRLSSPALTEQYDQSFCCCFFLLCTKRHFGWCGDRDKRNSWVSRSNAEIFYYQNNALSLRLFFLSEKFVYLYWKITGTWVNIARCPVRLLFHHKAFQLHLLQDATSKFPSLLSVLLMSGALSSFLVHTPRLLHTAHLLRTSSRP